MRADERALVALDAEASSFQTGISLGDAALLELRRADRETCRRPASPRRAAGRPSPAIIGSVTVSDEFGHAGTIPRRPGRQVGRRASRSPIGTSCSPRARHRCAAKFACDDVLALGAVRLLHGALDRGNRGIARQHARQREEARLQDGVDALAGARRPPPRATRRSRRRAASSRRCVPRRGGQLRPTACRRGKGLFSRTVAPGAACAEHVGPCRAVPTGGRRRTAPGRPDRSIGSAAARTAGARPSSTRTSSSRRRNSPARAGRSRRR